MRAPAALAAGFGAHGVLLALPALLLGRPAVLLSPEVVAWGGAALALQAVELAAARGGDDTPVGADLDARLAGLTAALLVAIQWIALGERVAGGGASTAPALAGALLAGGIALRGAAMRTLGSAFVSDVEGRPGAPLVLAGPYRWLRHPSEVGLVAYALGGALLLGSQVALVGVGFALVPLVVWRTRREDRALAARFPRVAGSPRAAWGALLCAAALVVGSPARAQEDDGAPPPPLAELEVLAETVIVQAGEGPEQQIAAGELSAPRPLAAGEVVLVGLGGRAEARLAGSRVLLGENVTFEARRVEGDLAEVRLLGVDLELERVTVLEANLGSLRVELVEGKLRVLPPAEALEVVLTAGALRSRLRLQPGQTARALRDPGARALGLEGQGLLEVEQPDGTTVEVALPVDFTWDAAGAVTFGGEAPLLPEPVPARPVEPSPAAEPPAGDAFFERFRAGLRVGFSYRPELNLDARIGGKGADPTAAPAEPTDVDVPQQLGVTEGRTTEFLVDFNHELILDLEAFVESRWVNASLWWITPYEYRGETSLTRTIVFGGEQFLATSVVRATFRQFTVGADVAVNLLNGEYLRVSPLVGLRMFGFDWRVEDSLANVDPNAPRADSGDLDVPFSLAGYEVLPHPEVGIEVWLGNRRKLEAGFKLTGATIQAYGLVGRTLRAEVTAAVYPLDALALQLGFRWSRLELRSTSDDPRDRFDIRFEQLGLTGGILLRFG